MPLCHVIVLHTELSLPGRASRCFEGFVFTRISNVALSIWDALFSTRNALEQGFLTGGIRTPWEYGNQMLGVWDSIPGYWYYNFIIFYSLKVK